MSRWIVRWMEPFVFEKDPLQAAEAKIPILEKFNALRFLRFGNLVIIW
jgi:hypothetical protein